MILNVQMRQGRPPPTPSASGQPEVAGLVTAEPGSGAEPAPSLPHAEPPREPRWHHPPPGEHSGVTALTKASRAQLPD